MVTKLVYALLVAVVVYLLAWLILGLLPVVNPETWAAVLGILAGLLSFANGRF